MTNKNKIIKLIHIGDIFAIPLFLLSSIYFLKKKKRNLVENILLIFSISGFLFDILFTIIYFSILI